MSSFPEIEVGEILGDDRGICVGVMYPGEDTAGGVPLIRVGDIAPTGINPKPNYRISEAVHHEYRRTALLGGECLITLVGRPGQAVVVPPEMAGWNAARALAVVRLKDPEDARFFALSMASPSVQHAIKNLCNTTVQATLNLKEIRTLRLPWPAKNLRVVLAETLGALDDKIEVNRRMNETLEAMARAVFRDWFVDFGPTRRQMAGASDPHAILGGLIQTPRGMTGKVGTGFPSDMPANNEQAHRLAALFPDALGDNGLPEGWEEGTLSNYAALNPKSWTAKKHPETLEYVDLANTKWGTIESTIRFDWDDAPSRARRIIEPGDTIVGTVRPGNGSYAYIGDEGLTASTGFAVLRPKTKALSPFVNCAATSEENIETLASLADGGAYPAVRPDVVLATPAPLASEELVGAFGLITQTLLDKVEANKRENRTLAATRDLLLPKLMSGEIRLKDAEAMV